MKLFRRQLWRHSAEVVGMILQGTKNLQNTTCSGMTEVSFGLYSESPPQECGGNVSHTRIKYLRQEAKMDFDNSDNIGGYAVPVDPMDLLQCDSCQ
jgi:hypothetical protein